MFKLCETKKLNDTFSFIRVAIVLIKIVIKMQLMGR